MVERARTELWVLMLAGGKLDLSGRVSWGLPFQLVLFGVLLWDSVSFLA